MTPRVSTEHRDFARRLRRELTEAETILWRALRNRGLKAKFRRQVPIGPYVADFVCAAARLVIELDGRPHESFDRQQRDGERDLWFAEQGWRVLRIPNDLVLGSDVLGRIDEALKRGLDDANVHLLPHGEGVAAKP